MLVGEQSGFRGRERARESTVSPWGASPSSFSNKHKVLPRLPLDQVELPLRSPLGIALTSGWSRARAWLSSHVHASLDILCVELLLIYIFL